MRHRLHVLASIVLWLLFGYYWAIVLRREISESTVRAVGTLAGLVVVGLALTGLWIRHNLRLARKFADRRRTPAGTAHPALRHDTLGRPITAPDLAVLRGARAVEITADADGKTYRVVAQGPGAGDGPGPEARP